MILRKRGLVALPLLPSVCYVSVVVLCPFLMVPLVGPECVPLHLLAMLAYTFIHDRIVRYRVYVLSQDNIV